MFEMCEIVNNLSVPGKASLLMGANVQDLTPTCAFICPAPQPLFFGSQGRTNKSPSSCDKILFVKTHETHWLYLHLKGTSAPPQKQSASAIFIMSAVIVKAPLWVLSMPTGHLR